MSESAIEVEEVFKRFGGGGAAALDGLSLSIPAGTVYGLLGPNGAGKTTLIRILATLLPADAGTARVAGFDVRRDPAAVRERIGLAGQHAAVDGHLTGRENVEMIGRLYGCCGNASAGQDQVRRCRSSDSSARSMAKASARLSASRACSVRRGRAAAAPESR